MQFVSVNAAQANLSYWRVFENMFKEVAARILQRHIRRKRFRRNLSVSKITARTVLTNKLSMQFIQEPYIQIADTISGYIQSGHWLHLPFDNPQFVLHLYKVLRLGKISIDELSTALFLHSAKQLFGVGNMHEVRQFAFDQPGPHDFRKISYSDSYHQQKFLSALKKLPRSAQMYFCINFSKKAELMFLYNVLTFKDDYKLLKIQSIWSALKIMIQRYFVTRSPFNQGPFPSAELRQSFIVMSQADHFTLLKPQQVLDLKKLYALIGFEINRSCFTTEEQQSMYLLSAILVLEEQMPTISLSPDYDARDARTPILSFILPHMSALTQLQLSLHGKDTTHLFFTAGQVSINLIQTLDEQPQKYGLVQQARPVEICHPDLLSTPIHHGLKVLPFMLSWHDLFHCWRNGAMPLKPLVRQLRKFFARETQFAMSKFIWGLVDMDFSTGRLIREAQIKKNCVEPGTSLDNHGMNKILSYRYYFYENLLEMVVRATTAHVDNKPRSDLVLLYLMFFLKQKSQNLFFLLSLNYQYFNVHQIGKALKHIMLETPHQPSSMYLVLLKLRGYTYAKTICAVVHQYLGFESLFKWTRNAGLIINPAVSHPKMCLDPLYASDAENEQVYQFLFALAQPFLNLNHFAWVFPDSGSPSLTPLNEMRILFEYWEAHSLATFSDLVPRQGLSELFNQAKATAYLVDSIEKLSLQKRHIIYQDLGLLTQPQLLCRYIQHMPVHPQGQPFVPVLFFPTAQRQDLQNIFSDAYAFITYYLSMTQPLRIVLLGAYGADALIDFLQIEKPKRYSDTVHFQAAFDSTIIIELLVDHITQVPTLENFMAIVTVAQSEGVATKLINQMNVTILEKILLTSQKIVTAMRVLTAENHDQHPALLLAITRIYMHLKEKKLQHNCHFFRSSHKDRQKIIAAKALCEVLINPGKKDNLLAQNKILQTGTLRIIYQSC